MKASFYFHLTWCSKPASLPWEGGSAKSWITMCYCVACETRPPETTETLLGVIVDSTAFYREYRRDCIMVSIGYSLQISVLDYPLSLFHLLLLSECKLSSLFLYEYINKRERNKLRPHYSQYRTTYSPVPYSDIINYSRYVNISKAHFYRIEEIRYRGITILSHIVTTLTQTPTLYLYNTRIIHVYMYRLQI
jgi:hypothetical protein